MVRAKNFRNRLADAIIYIILGVSALACLAPIINTIAVSLSDKAAAAAGIVYFIPVKFTLYSYEILLSDKQFWVSFGISIKRVLLGTAINLIMVILMAYPLSKEKKAFKARNVYMWVIVFTMLFSGGLIPWYMLISKLKLLNTIWALVLPGAVPVFNVILLMNFFRGVPKELEEAGVVDGAGPWLMLIKIYLPISVPALATITLFTVVGHWNSFFDGLILINKAEKYPLQTYIQQLVSVLSQIRTENLSAEEIKKISMISNKTLNASKIIISMIPILCVYPFLQKYFIHGIVLGSVKE